MKIIFYVILFILSVGVVTATYPYVGYNDFQQEEGNFNSALSTVEDYTKAVTVDGKIFPLVDDLDSDGQNEIILIDGNFLKVYQNRELDQIASLSTGCVGTYNDFGVYDLDGDSYKEIILLCQDGGGVSRSNRIKVYNFNGTTIILNSTNTTQSFYYATFGCDESTGVCALGGFLDDGVSTAPVEVIVQAFNKTDIGNPLDLQFYGGTVGHCLPSGYNMPVGDYDGDGDNNMVFGFVTKSNSVSKAFYTLEYLEINVSLNISRDLRVVTEDLDYSAMSNSCHDEDSPGRASSAPLLANLASTPGLETVIAFEKDTDEFIMEMYDNTGSRIDRYPSVFNADGQIISNPMLINARHDTAIQDFCVLGYDSNTNELDLVCASEYGGLFPKTDEFKIDVSATTQINITEMNRDIVTHATQQISTTTSGNNLDEIVTPYGIFEIDYSGVNELIEVYPNPVNASSKVMMVDVEGVGLSDMLILSRTNLFYYDDGFTNHVGYIDTTNDYTTVNPCLDAVWKHNTTVQVSLQVSDVDGDNVCGRATLYHGDANQQNGSFICGGEGSIFTFDFIANTTIASGVLRLEGYDVENNDSIQTEDYSFTVATNGVELGECETIFSITPPDESGATTPETVTSDTAGNTTAVGDNTISVGMKDIADQTGLGTTIVWLLLMGGIAGLIFFANRDEKIADDRSALMVVSGVEIIMLIIGTMLGFLSSGILWTIIILCVVIGGFWVGNRFFSRSPVG